MFFKGIAFALLILMVASVKADYNMRALIFVVVVGGLLYLGLSKGRR